MQAKFREKKPLFSWPPMPHGVPSMPKNLGKIQFYPKPVKWTTLFRANPVIILLQVNSLTLNNLHYIVLDLWKDCQTTSPSKRKSEFWYCKKDLRLVYFCFPLWMEFPRYEWKTFLSKQWILNGIYRKGSGDFFNYRFQSGKNCLTLKSFCRIVLLRNKNDEKKCKWWYFLHLFDWTFDIRLTEQRGNFEFWTLFLLNFQCSAFPAKFDLMTNSSCKLSIRL